LSYDSSSNQDEFARELSIGESFNKSFDLAGRNYLKLLPIFAVFGILAALVSGYVNSVTPALSLPTNASTLTPAQDLAALSVIVRYLEFVAANFFLTQVILYVAAGIGVWRICKSLGQKQDLHITLPDHINYVSLILTVLIAAAIIEISLIIIVGPLIFGTLFYLCLASCTIEGKSVFSSLGRSRQLVSGKWGKTFIIFVGIQVVVYIGSALISGIIGLFISSSVVTSIVQNFIMALEFPLVSASMVVLYFSFSRGHERLIQKPPSLYDNMTPQPMGGFGKRSFCSACGAAVSGDEKFCHNCGATLATQF